jgi:hypothetical protein
MWKRFFFYLCAFFIITPVIKQFGDILTDNTTGILHLAADNMTVNGVVNPAGNYLLLLYRMLPYIIGIFIIVELFMWLGGRKKNKEQQRIE